MVISEHLFLYSFFSIKNRKKIFSDFPCLFVVIFPFYHSSFLPYVCLFDHVEGLFSWLARFRVFPVFLLVITAIRLMTELKTNQLSLSSPPLPPSHPTHIYCPSFPPTFSLSLSVPLIISALSSGTWKIALTNIRRGGSILKPILKHLTSTKRF